MKTMSKNHIVYHSHYICIYQQQYLTKFIETKSIPGKIYGNSGMVHFAEINQVPSPYSMLQNIGRVATAKLVLRNCLRYLQTALIMGNAELVSELCEVLSKKLNGK